MGVILRWFYVDGRRYHAFLHAHPGAPEIVIRSSDFQAVVPVPADAALGDFADEELAGFVCVSGSAASPPPSLH